MISGRWIEVLSNQAKQIAAGNCVLDKCLFDGAPADIAALGAELDNIARAMVERDRVQKLLTHEVHHRVKNSLQIVTSLLNMQVKSLQDPAAKKALGQTRARMAALALIHRLIYELGDESTKGHINAATLITELCKQLKSSSTDQPGVVLDCDASDLEIPFDDAVPLALLTVEAVTNAFGHAFPEQRRGKIAVTFAVEEKTARLKVVDNGTGFTPTERKTASMGGQLMVALAHQLGGTLTIDSSLENGTHVVLNYALRH